MRKISINVTDQELDLLLSAMQWSYESVHSNFLEIKLSTLDRTEKRKMIAYSELVYDVLKKYSLQKLNSFGKRKFKLSLTEGEAIAFVEGSQSRIIKPITSPLVLSNLIAIDRKLPA